MPMDLCYELFSIGRFENLSWKGKCTKSSKGIRGIFRWKMINQGKLTFGLYPFVYNFTLQSKHSVKPELKHSC